MKQLLFVLLFCLTAAPALAQRPSVATTVNTTDTTAASVCVGCPVGSTTPASNSGATAHTITLKDATPSVTTNKLYNIGGALYFNGLSLATGSSVSGTTGTVPKFTGPTALGDSNATISGNNWTFASATLTAAAFAGSGAALTSIPTSAVSSGNFVATVASGTGITSSVTSGNAAATTISLNNTAVTPGGYGSPTAIAAIVIDQQGRITSASGVTPQLTLTSTFFSSLSGANLTSLPAANLTGTLASGVTINLAAQTLSGDLPDVNLSANIPLLNAADNTFARNGAGATSITLTNATSGTGNYAYYAANAGTTTTYLYSYSQGYTTSGLDIAASSRLAAGGAGGLTLSATDAAGVIRFYAGGTTLGAELNWGSGGQSLRVMDTTGSIGVLIGVNPTYAGSENSVTGADRANGTGSTYGSLITAGRNTSGNGAPGAFISTTKGGALYAIWADSTGVARINAGPPTETSGDTGGTVIGTQTSTLDTKRLIAPFRDTRRALDVVAGAALWRFKYKDNAYSGSEFVGVMSNTTPEVMMDPSPDHPEGRSFSPVSAFGYTAAAVAELRKQLEQLKNPYKRLFQVEWP